MTETNQIDENGEAWWMQLKDIEDAKVLKSYSKHTEDGARIVVAGNRHTPSDALDGMLDDPNPAVQFQVGANPNLAKDVYGVLFDTGNHDRIMSIACNTSLPTEFGIKILKRGNQIEVQALMEHTEDPLIASICLNDREKAARILMSLGDEPPDRGASISIEDIFSTTLKGWAEHFIGRLERVAGKN